ncbi:hypothetical protein [Vibrio rumoiensis]|uniref:Uncharacterized protein n=1 Tax=Vibrio rumoiensis TaxID=76258 RepID=A0ABW7J3E6_9VIBR
MSYFSQAREMLKQSILDNFGDPQEVQTVDGVVPVIGYVKCMEEDTTKIFTFYTDAHLPPKSTLAYNDSVYELSLSAQQNGKSSRSNSQIIREYIMNPQSAAVQNGWSEYPDDD